MGESLIQLVELLRRGGVISEEEASSIKDATDNGTVRDDKDVLAEVAGHLTDFQKSEVLNGKADNLILGDYLLILDRLGQGGMGQVFKARHTLMKRDVAVKFTLPDKNEKSDSTAKERFIREVETASKLSHPNIVSALDAGHRGDLCYLVMEYVRGHNLNRLVRTQGPMSFVQALEVTLQVAYGLEYAHRQGVTHRDIKPSNILLRDDGVVKVLDMGLARIDSIENYDSSDSQATEGEEELTRRGQLLGTVDFMAPEQAVNPHEADGRSDIYSLGCTLYFLLTSKPPYRQDGTSVMSRLIAHRETPIPDLRDARGDVPEWFAPIFRKMLAKTPKKRYQNVSELVANLESASKRARESDETLDETLELPSEGVPAKWLGVGALCVLLAWGGWYGIQQLPTQTPPAIDSADPGPPAVIRNDSLTYNLLDHLDLSRDVLTPPQRDGWSLSPEALELPPGDPTTKLRYRVETAPDFRLDIDVMRTGGTGPFAVGLFAQERQFLFLVDRSGTTLLLTSGGRSAAHVDGLVAIEEGQPTRLEFDVKGNSVTLKSGGQIVLDWPDLSSLDRTPKQGWTIGDEQAFVLGSNNSSGFRVTHLKIEPLLADPP